jgi:DNA-binding winged helix-turn-helix (wHTH) protein
MRQSFDEYVFDSSARRLSREGRPIHLSPKAFALLELLIEARPRVLAKKEIIGCLWPDVFVAEGSLANVVLEVRKALGDVADRSRYLRTVHGFGYAFCGAETKTATGEWLDPSRSTIYRLESPFGEVFLDEGDSLIGRAPECRVCLPSSTVSRHHARLVLRAGKASVEDLGSKNGTHLRGERIFAPAPLQDGERFRVGSVSLVLRVFCWQTATDSFPAGDG